MGSINSNRGNSVLSVYSNAIIPISFEQLTYEFASFFVGAGSVITKFILL
jgi:hypothetical protein